MARFTGTLSEFTTFIGPWVRNQVQYITKKEKAKHSRTCASCGQRGIELEAAHIHGNGRKNIITTVLEPYTDSSGHIDCDLADIKSQIVAAHHPIEKAFLFLCRKCHQSYDRTGTLGGTGTPSTAPQLPITLDPVNEEVFKKALLKSRIAAITIVYKYRPIETNIWHANRFSETSNVMGNLRSRPEFRHGVWQAAGIESVHVKVIEHER